MLAVVEQGEDVRMAETGDDLKLALALTEQRYVILLDVGEGDDGDVVALGRLVRRVGGGEAVALGLLDDAIGADVRAGNETRHRFRAGLVCLHCMTLEPSSRLWNCSRSPLTLSTVINE